MPEPVIALVLDLVEWIAKEPRPYAEAIAAWRTSCPRLTIWEDAIDLGYIERQPSKRQTLIVVTKAGERFLRAHGRGRQPIGADEATYSLRHPEVRGVKRRASKGDGPAPAVHPSRLASRAPQDDG